MKSLAVALTALVARVSTNQANACAARLVRDQIGLSGKSGHLGAAAERLQSAAAISLGCCDS